MPLQFVAQGPMLIPAGGVWSPLTSNAKFWYDMTDITTLNGGTPPANLAHVTTIADKSVSGSTMTAVGGGGSDGQYLTNVLNGKACVSFDNPFGTFTEFDATLASGLAQPFFVMIVFKTSASTADSGFGNIWRSGFGAILRPKYSSVGNNFGFHAGADASLGAATSLDTAYYAYCNFNSNVDSYGRLSSSTETPHTLNPSTNGIGTSHQLGDITDRIFDRIFECFCIPSISPADKALAVAYVAAKYNLPP